MTAAPVVGAGTTDTAAFESDGWKVCAARVRGPSHETAGEPCQDAFAVRAADGVLVAVVADGAGSAPCAADGAALGARAVVEALTAADLPDLGAGAARDTIAGAVGAARAAVLDQPAPEAEAAMTEGARLARYHATLVGAVSNGRHAWLFHIGDGVGAAFTGEAWEGATRPKLAWGDA